MNAIMKAVVMGACLVALAACGSDDDEGEGNAGAGGAGGEGGDSGSSGASGAGEGGASGAGEGGTSGAGEGGTSGGGTGGMMAEPVVCGGETCGTPSSDRLSACCADDECGVMTIGVTPARCTVPVQSHPDCDGAMLGNFEIPSCCNAEGRCGLAAMRLFDEPCTSIEGLLQLAADAADGGTADGGGISFGDNVPDPAACTPLED